METRMQVIKYTEEDPVPGQRYGFLVATGQKQPSNYKRGQNNTYFEYLCDCGKTCWKTKYCVKAAKSKVCNGHRCKLQTTFNKRVKPLGSKPKIELLVLGETYGLYTLISMERRLNKRGKERNQVLVECICGLKLYYNFYHLLRFNSPKYCNHTHFLK